MSCHPIHNWHRVPLRTLCRLPRLEQVWQRDDWHLWRLGRDPGRCAGEWLLTRGPDLTTVVNRLESRGARKRNSVPWQWADATILIYLQQHE